MFPGPLIMAKKVGHTRSSFRVSEYFKQGNEFRLNVINMLDNNTMLTNTSIVRGCPIFLACCLE